MTFIFAFAALGMASLLFPLWLAALSPLVWGSAHVLASLRFSSEFLAPGNGWTSARTPRPFTILLAASFVAGLGRMVGPEVWPAGGELFLLGVVAFSVLALAGRSSRRAVPAGLLLAVLGISFWQAPWVTLAVLTFGHHVVAFVVWFRSSSSASERRVVLLSLGLFAVFHVFLFAGAWDGFADFSFVTLSLPGNVWDFSSLAALTGHEWRGLRVYHFAVAFVFGQSLHYVIWLKLIPEARLIQSVPRTFRQSYHDWFRQVGFLPLALALAGPVILAVIACFAGLATAQLTYVALAAFHGYGEILSLGFSRRAG